MRLLVYCEVQFHLAAISLVYALCGWLFVCRVWLFVALSVFPIKYLILVSDLLVETCHANTRSQITDQL